jgi:4a-hydroxytetrahydrobiopterin dehydratase
MAALNDADIVAKLAALDDWQRDGAQIVKTFRFANYHETLAFVNASAWISHRTDHHPDLDVGYNRCTVRYSTHDAGGLTTKDFDCAARLDALFRI